MGANTEGVKGCSGSRRILTIHWKTSSPVIESDTQKGMSEFHHMVSLQRQTIVATGLDIIWLEKGYRWKYSTQNEFEFADTRAGCR